MANSTDLSRIRRRGLNILFSLCLLRCNSRVKCYHRVCVCVYSTKSSVPTPPPPKKFFERFSSTLTTKTTKILNLNKKLFWVQIMLNVIRYFTLLLVVIVI